MWAPTWGCGRRTSTGWATTNEVAAPAGAHGGVGQAGDHAHEHGIDHKRQEKHQAGQQEQTESGDPSLQGGIWGFGIFDNGDAAKVEAAKAFVKFMTEDEAQYKKIVEATGYWATRDVSGLYAGTEDEALMTHQGLEGLDVLGAVGGVAGEVGIGVLAAVHVGDESAVALVAALAAAEHHAHVGMDGGHGLHGLQEVGGGLPGVGVLIDASTA